MSYKLGAGLGIGIGIIAVELVILLIAVARLLLIKVDLVRGNVEEGYAAWLSSYTFKDVNMTVVPMALIS